MERRYWRVTEVAEALALSRSKVTLMIRNGEIPSERWGRAVRVPADALDDLLRRRAQLGELGRPMEPQEMDR